MPPFRVRGGMQRIYLDHAATTPVDARVLQKMLPCFTDHFGNAHSLHAFGRRAVAAVDAARDAVASLLGAKPQEIYFTSGGTEADNWALRGAVHANAGRGRHVIISAVEHPAVRAAARLLAQEGFAVSAAPVGADGVLDLAAFAGLLRGDTVLAAVMAVNNETGAVQPLAEISRLCRERGVLLFCDAVQAAGAYVLDVNAPPVDLLSISSHKFYGPKGVGALYVREGVRIAPLVAGGEQERGLRGGTSNVAGAVGFAAALELAQKERAQFVQHTDSVRTLFEQKIFDALGGEVRADGERRCPNISHLTFEHGGTAFTDILDLAGVACSRGAACSSHSAKPSHVLMAMGRSAEESLRGVRFSFGMQTSEKDAADAAQIVIESYRRFKGGIS